MAAPSLDTLLKAPVEVRAYLYDLEARLESSWAGHHVLIVVVVAFVAGLIF